MLLSTVFTCENRSRFTFNWLKFSQLAFGSIYSTHRDGILIVLTQMEMTTKPSLNTPMLSNQLDKLLTLLLIRMIQPTTSINDVIFLQNSQPTSVGRGVSEYEHLPAIFGRMGLYEIFKPVDLSLINGDLVRGVDCITEDSGAHADKEGFVCDLLAELGRFLLMCF